MIGIKEEEKRGQRRGMGGEKRERGEEGFSTSSSDTVIMTFISDDAVEKAVVGQPVLILWASSSVLLPSCFLSDAWPVYFWTKVESHFSFQSCLTCDPWNSPGQNTQEVGEGFSFLLWLLPTQVLNPGFPHCRKHSTSWSHEPNKNLNFYFEVLKTKPSSHPIEWGSRNRRLNLMA